MRNTIPVIKWTYKTTYFDVDSGLEITKYTADTLYQLIKTKKNVTLNTNKTKGHIEYTKLCRNRRQLELFKTN